VIRTLTPCAGFLYFGTVITMPPRVAGHILIAEDESALGEILEQHLTSLGHRVTRVSDGRGAMRALTANSFDVAVLDSVMPAPDGLEVLRALADDPDPPAVIIAAAQGTIDTAVHAMKRGAFGYLAKPYRMTELDVVVTRALEHRALAHQNASLRDRLTRAEGEPAFLTQYAPLRAVLAAAMAAAGGDEPLLIVGGPGTGKCALARAMHARSRRAARPFIQLDSGTLSNEHVTRTFFGVDRSDRSQGVRAALATRGSLYLHDVHAMTRPVQVRLGDALRNGKFRATPRGEERGLVARVLAAARGWNERPEHTASPELCDVFDSRRITLPTLRERAVDIPLLANAFLALNGNGNGAPQFDPVALDALQEYPWPGNVAELRAVVERARMLCRDGVIRIVDLSLAPADHQLELAEVERRHILAVLRANDWHQGKSAESLGISAKTLYRKIREFSLLRPSPETRGESPRNRR
jgi:two-component system, NtrC family, response regulator AtoC